MHSFPSVFYIGFEKSAKANDIMLTLTHKTPVDLTASWAAYQQLVYDYPATRVNYVLNQNSRRYEWQFMEQPQITRLLRDEEHQQNTFHSKEAVYSAYYPTNHCLPIRIRHINANTSVFVISHVFADGRTTFSWLNEWCKRYQAKALGETPTVTDNPDIPDSVPPHWNNPGKPQGRAALAWSALTHLLSLSTKAAFSPGRHLVDVSRGRCPDPEQTGSHVAGLCFSQEQTRDIISAAHAAGLSTAGYIHHALSSALFECFPEKSKQLFGIASDVSGAFPCADPLAPGCLINPHLQVLNKNKPLRDQVRHIYQQARSGMPVSLLALSSLIVPSEQFLEKHVAKGTLVPARKRSLLERLSFIYSHVRDGDFQSSNQVLESISGHTKSQTVFVASTIINGRLSLEMCATRMLFSPTDIDQWFDKTVDSLITGRFQYA